MLGIGRFSGRAAAAIVIVVVVDISLFFAEMTLQRKKLSKPKIKSRIISLEGISLPREPILGSIKSGLLCRNGPPKKRTPKSKIKSRIISLGGISLPREPILDSVIVWACSACSACSA